MTPQEALFGRYYDAALQLRGEFRNSPALAGWFSKTRNHPPIVCFGFLDDSNERIPIATLGANPSSRECAGPVSMSNDPVDQFRDQVGYFEREPAHWSEWFRRAAVQLKALSEDLPEEQRASYRGKGVGRRTVIPLDLTPVITARIGTGRLRRSFERSLTAATARSCSRCSPSSRALMALSS